MMAGRIAVLGAGLMGCCLALALARRGLQVVVFERREAAMLEASLHSEGKLHLGFVYAADPSLRTAALMQRGAACFAAILERWLGAGVLDPLQSEPFVYAVHRDSQLSVPSIEAHFARVQALWTGPPEQAAWRRLSPGELEASFDPGLVRAAYRTGERAVDTGRVAELLRDALRADPRVELRTGFDVAAVAGTAGAFRVHGTVQGAACRDGPFAQIVNCLWANRPAVDVASGLEARPAAMIRHKVGLFLQAEAGADRGAPSTTFVLGPFGDIVAWPCGRLYLAWYPAGMVGVARQVARTDWRAVRAGLDAPAIAAATIAALARLCPRLAAVVAGARPVVDGGAIYALGATDIDDPRSRLHQRSEVGLVAAQDGYHSVDTGKYTLAPLLAEDLATRIAAGAGTARP
ncbi:FAD-dependent oxidoreductase [Roseomonas sp. HF4]|uniref:FAD-dependent oxidoreductase n=1 Tax=Roseomonas sp. HF4 TaxID=2562313 RepID=UPI0010BFD899|nr:FAD-dependent oxidoreductase [Roseomonas sp. HF4]